MGGIELLGPLRVDDGAVLEPRDRAALSVLAVRRGMVVSPDEFAEALWRDAPPNSWPKQVQICVGRLRKIVGPEAIETVGGGYRLALDGDAVDIDRFEELIERARLLSATGEADRAAATYGRALSLWRGRPLDELDGWLPGRSEAVRLEELHRTIEEDWLEARIAAGEHREVAADAESLVIAEPLRERRWAALATAQYRCGRQADALRSLARARRTLVEQLGIDPGPELVALEAAILHQDAGLAVVAAPVAASDACPYKGLAHYDAADAETFWGRQADVADCVRRLQSTTLLVITGPSGCGKSSLVRAGLVPALRHRGQNAVVMVPGTDPAAAMIDATISTDRPALLVIDQFEELFTLGSRPDVVRDFCRQVVEYAEHRARVVIAVRSDQLGGLSIDPTLSRLAEQGLYLVNPLVGDALRESIERPADIAGLRLEPGLIDVLMRDCEGEPGALPLLSHALVETWRRRDGNVLTLEGYRTSGGIRGAVARSADRLYDSLPPDQRLTLRSVLLRLVTPSLDGEPVRCRVPSRSLVDTPGRERVLALLVRSRLVTSEADTFELAHEALARAWPRLQSWLDDDAAGQRILRHLTTAAEGWESLGRAGSELYRGARLEAALEWRDATQPDLTALERAFLDASADQAATESRALADRAQRDARQNRRLRGLLVGVGILLVASIIGGALAIGGRHEARQQRDAAQTSQARAEQQSDAARTARDLAEQQSDAAATAQDRAERESTVAVGRELAAAATANLSVDPERSVLLALAAVEQTRDTDGSVLPEVEEALHHAVTTNQILSRIPDVGGALDWSPDGAVFVTEGPPGSRTVDIRDARTGESVRSFRGHQGDITDVAFNHDGTLVATTSTDGTARVWQTATGREMDILRGASGRGAWGPSFSADGRWFAAAWPKSGVVRILDLETGLAHETRAVPGPIATSFAPDGRQLAIASNVVPSAAVIDTVTGQQTRTLTGHFGALNDIAWSPNGSRIATAADDASVRLFDPATGNQQFALLEHKSRVVALDWSSDSTRLVTGAADRTARVWGLIEGDGRELATLSAYDTALPVTGVAFSPDGSRVMTGDRGGTSTIIWDVGVTAGTEIANVPSVVSFAGAVEFTADGRRVVASAGGGAIGVWDTRTWKRVATVGGRTRATHLSTGESLPTPDDVERLAVDPTGRLVAIVRSAGEGRVEVWDLETGDERFAVEAGNGWPWVAWSPDGRHLAVSDGERRRLTVVDTTGREVAHKSFRARWVGFVAFSPDGDRVVTSLEPSRAVLWNWRTDEIERSIDTTPDIAVPSPDGDLIAVKPLSGARSRAVEIWDARTGRLVTTLAGQTGEVSYLTFTADGSRLATSSADGTIRLWDPRSGELQLTLYGHPVSVTKISFSPDGSQLASYGGEGTVRVWALDLDELVAIARARLTRDFTTEECREFLHTEECSVR